MHSGAGDHDCKQLSRGLAGTSFLIPAPRELYAQKTGKCENWANVPNIRLFLQLRLRLAVVSCTISWHRFLVIKIDAQIPGKIGLWVSLQI